MHRKLDRQNKVQSEKESKNTRQFYKVILIHESMISKAPSFQFQNASFQNGYSLPISKKKKKLNTIQSTPSTIPSTILLKILSDSPKRPKVQTPAWIAESKAILEKAVLKFNSTTKQT